MVDVHLTKEKESCDISMVEHLVDATTNALSGAIIEDVTTQSEVLSAIFTLLDRTLRGVRKLQPPEERAYNAKEIARVLNEMLVDFGKVPS